MSEKQTRPDVPTCRASQIEEPNCQVMGDQPKRTLIRVTVPVIVEQTHVRPGRNLAAGCFVKSPFDASLVKPWAEKPQA